VRVDRDKFTSKSRGFAFVEMGTQEEATKAIEMFETARISADEHDRERSAPREERSGGGGHGGGVAAVATLAAAAAVGAIAIAGKSVAFVEQCQICSGRSTRACGRFPLTLRGREIPEHSDREHAGRAGGAHISVVSPR